MKTIGLLTFHFPVNYGAVLQTYALYSFVKRGGYDIEIINYYTDEHMGRYDFYQKPQNLKNLIYYIAKTFFINDDILKKKRFRRFISLHFKLSQRYKDDQSILFDYDTVITGSDQVFNLETSKSLVYFQPFEKKGSQKKIAYAPSFGKSEFSRDLKDKIGKYVKDFDAISCRENDGASFLAEIMGKPVLQVLDPVFLLSNEDWSDVSSKRLIKDDYIFIYDLNGRKPLVDIAKTVNENNYKIVMVSNDPIAKMRSEYKGVDVFLNSAGIEQFLSLIKYSTSTITDSFHGTAFSIIFQRPFYTYIAYEAVAVRITSLLKNLSLQDRIITKDTPLSSIRKIGEIPDITIRLNEQIEKSESYLINSLYE